MSKLTRHAVPLKRSEPAENGGFDNVPSLQNRTVTPPGASSLAALHQQSVALELMLGGKSQTLLGRSVYETDPELGGILRIELPSDALCEFVIVENSWNGDVQSGTDFGCEFLIRLV